MKVLTIVLMFFHLKNTIRILKMDTSSKK